MADLQAMHGKKSRLEHWGLTEIEYALMKWALFTGFGSESLMAMAYEWLVQDHWETAPRAITTQYRKELDRAIFLGHLKIATPEDCLRDRQAREGETIPSCSTADLLESGAVDFTPEGYSLYCSALWWVSNEYRTGYSEDETRRQVTVYSDSIQGCYQWLGFWLNGHRGMSTHTFGDDAFACQVASVSLPQPVQAWRFSRHEIIHDGWAITIQYGQPNEVLICPF